MRYYHGTFETDIKVTELEVRHPGYLGLGPGIYFTPCRQTAQSYGDRILETELTFTNPLLVDPEEPLTTVNGKIEVCLRIYEDEDSISGLDDMRPFDVIAADGDTFEVRSMHDLARISDWARYHGHDAVVMRNMRSSIGQEVVIWDSSLIKDPQPALCH